MISFIIIGRNEGWKLTKCLKSVFESIKYIKLKSYEVIYVDSRSTDNSIERAKKFKEIKIFQLTGEFNAAIARNIGAMESKGDSLFFIDGDMELFPDFLIKVYSERKGLISDFISGQIRYINYNNQGKELSRGLAYKNVLASDQYVATTGGIFIIKKVHWNLVGGMDIKYKRGQDIDLGLRLSKRGILLLRKKDLICAHHTTPYYNYKRIFLLLLKGSINYSTSLLYRNHINNKYMYPKMIRVNFTILFLFSGILLGFITNNLYFIFVYLFGIVLKLAINQRKHLIDIPMMFVYYIIRDFSVLFGLFLFHPKNISKEQINYLEIK